MPETAPEPHVLTFHWLKPVMKARGLAFWMLVVLLGLAAFFYLFQVVYPQAQRFTPVPHYIVALNPADPAARELMNKVQDMDFLILPPSSESAGTVNLEEHSPVFHPTFEGHSLQLQDLPHKAFQVPPARLLQTDAPVLPPLDFSELRPVTATVKPVVNANPLSLKLSGPLALRAMLQPPDLTGLALSDPPACRFQLGVNPDGTVSVALPVASVESAETLQKLTAVLQSIRFAPASAETSGPVWGTASFEWSKGGAP